MTADSFKYLRERIRLTILRLEGLQISLEDKTLAKFLDNDFKAFQVDFEKRKTPIEMAQEHVNAYARLSPGERKTYDNITKALRCDLE